MNVKEKLLSLLISGIIFVGVCIPSAAVAKASVSPWKVSKVALYSLLGVGCGLNALVNTVKKSTGAIKKEETGVLNIAFMAIASCYSFVWAYEEYQDILNPRRR